jgi:hypothetical protein
VIAIAAGKNNDAEFHELVRRGGKLEFIKPQRRRASWLRDKRKINTGGEDRRRYRLRLSW